MQLFLILRFSSLKPRKSYTNLAINIGSLVYLLPKIKNRCVFQSDDIERTWWRLYKKRVVRTKLDIYICIIFKLQWREQGHKQITFDQVELTKNYGLQFNTPVAISDTDVP
jgi:hypothetical protein